MRPEALKALTTSAVAEGIEVAARYPLDDVHAFFAAWVAPPGVWFEHLSSFWAHRADPNVLFVHFDDLKDDLDGEMRRVAAFLHLEIDEARWPRLVDRCTFASMKARGTEIGDFDRMFIGGADSFLYKGTNGRWRDLLTPEEVAMFDEASAHRLPPEANRWANRHLGVRAP